MVFFRSHSANWRPGLWCTYLVRNGWCSRFWCIEHGLWHCSKCSFDGYCLCHKTNAYKHGLSKPERNIYCPNYWCVCNGLPSCRHIFNALVRDHWWPCSSACWCIPSNFCTVQRWTPRHQQFIVLDHIHRIEQQWLWGATQCWWHQFHPTCIRCKQGCQWNQQWQFKL